MFPTSVNNLGTNVHFVLAVGTVTIPGVNKLVTGREEAKDSLPASHQGSPSKVGFYSPLLLLLCKNLKPKCSKRFGCCNATPCSTLSLAICNVKPLFSSAFPMMGVRSPWKRIIQGGLHHLAPRRYTA